MDRPLSARAFAGALARDFTVNTVGVESFTVGRAAEYVFLSTAGADVRAVFAGEEPPPDLRRFGQPAFVSLEYPQRFRSLVQAVVIALGERFDLLVATDAGEMSGKLFANRVRDDTTWDWDEPTSW